MAQSIEISAKTIDAAIEKGLLEERGRLEAPGRPRLYGTTPDFNVTDFTYEDFNIRNKMIIEYGTAYAFNYENRTQWDNTLYETIAMIKECESSNADKTF